MQTKTAPSSPPPAKKSDPREQTVTHTNKWGVMLAVGLSIFMGTLDVNIVNVSLPTLVKSLKTDFATIQWVMLGYILMVTSMTLSFSRLGDLRGKKNLFITGMGIFILGSLLCGLAPSVFCLIAFRALQGVGASITQALGAALVTEAFPSRERGRAMGIIGSTVSVGLAMGPALGGLLIGLFGWRSVFLINLPIGLVAIYVGLRFIPIADKAGDGRKFDPVGAVLLFLTLCGYALGMTLGQRNGFAHGPTMITLAAAAVLLTFFILVEMRFSDPIVNLRLFRNILFSLNLLMGWLVFIVIAASFLIPFFLELVKKYPPQTVGLLMMVMPLSMGLIAPLAGTMADRFGNRGMSLAGLMVIIGSCLLLSTLNEDTTLAGVILRLIPTGLGMGMFQSPNNSAIMGAVPRQHLGLASGLLALSRTLGHTTGIPLAGTLFTALVLSAAQMSDSSAVSAAPAQALVKGLSGAYQAAALIITLATILAAVALWLDHKRKLASVPK